MNSILFYNGNIKTQDETQPSAEAVQVENGKITAVGTSENLLAKRKSDTQLYDLKGQTLLPGFIDAHIHIWKVGNLLTYMLDLRGVSSLAEMKTRITDFAANKPHGEWIMARGFNEINFTDEQRLPNCHDLDEALSNHPICLIRTCAHITIANTQAMQAAQINAQTPIPEGGESRLDASGQLLGIFTETAQGLIQNRIPPYTAAQYEIMVDAAQNAMLRAGITSATDPAVMPDLLAVYHDMARLGKLKIRINAIPIMLPDGGEAPLPLPALHESDFLKIDTVKFFSDGGLSGKTAALLHPYKNEDYCGVLRIEADKFLRLTLEAQNLGFRVATHAIGDAALDMVTSVYAALQPDNHKQLRHRIEHVGLPTAEHLSRMQKHNIHAVSQPIFIYELGKNFRNSLTDDYLRICYPYRSIIDAGVTLSFSSDAPVVKDFSPLMGIQTALTRRDRDEVIVTESETISLDEAIAAYTIHAASANDDTRNRGSISIGKWADFVVLKENIFETPIENIKDIHVSASIVGGVVYAV